VDQYLEGYFQHLGISEKIIKYSFKIWFLYITVSLKNILLWYILGIKKYNLFQKSSFVMTIMLFKSLSLN